MSPTTARPSLLAAARQGIVEAFARPQWWVVFLVANLLSAWILAAPLRGFLSQQLDDNLYGESMATGASWRWFDTTDRAFPAAFGDLGAWQALLGERGVGIDDLRELSGPAAAIAWAGVLMFWMSAVLHCGFLASLYADRRGGAGAATVRFALPVSAFSFFALLTYAATYWLLYVETGRWLAGWSQRVDSEWLALGATWARLGLTLLGLLAVKLLFDVAKVVLVERGTWNWPWAFLVALRELARHGGRYARLYLLLGAAAPPLVALWWLAASQVKAGGWISLFLLFAAQQLFLLARIGLRLAHLAAARSLFLDHRSREAAQRPPYKVEVA